MCSGQIGRGTGLTVSRTADLSLPRYSAGPSTIAAAPDLHHSPFLIHHRDRRGRSATPSRSSYRPERVSAERLPRRTLLVVTPTRSITDAAAAGIPYGKVAGLTFGRGPAETFEVVR